MKLLGALQELHHSVFGGVERVAGNWLLPTLARLVFLAVLLVYYLNSGLGKFDQGFLTPGFGAYISILGESVVTAYDFDLAKLPFHFHLIVYAGSIAEVVLPVLIVIGLFTRIAALGMIVFVAVQSWVDVKLHGVGGDDLGAWLDRDSASLIMDQRLLWIFVLVVLVVKGAGALSLDRLFVSARNNRRLHNSM